MKTNDVRDDDGNPVMPFGKHKGVLLSDVPTDYLWWVLEGSDVIDRFPELAGMVEDELEERGDV